MEMTSRFINEPTARYPSCHASTIVECGNGDLLAAWFAGSREGAPDVEILSARRPKGAESWGEPLVLDASPDHANGNPVLFRAAGRVWFFWMTRGFEGAPGFALRCRASDDDGQTWSADLPIPHQHEWMPRNPALALDNGDIVLPIYDEQTWESMMLISTDGGDSWSVSERLVAPPPVGIIQPTLIQRDDGALLAWMRSNAESDKIWRAESQDRGRTWSQPVEIDLPNPNSAVCAARLGDGRVALVFNNTPEGRSPLNVAISEDQGEKWRVVATLEDEPGEFSYPCVIQTSDGAVQVTYTYRRTNIKHVTLRL